MTQTFELTEKQKEQRALAASKARHVLAFGGSRSTKTFGFCYFVATRALLAPQSRHLVGRLHNIDVRQAVMLDTFPKMMSLAYPNVKYKTHKLDQKIEMADSEVWFTGLDDKERVEKILGKEYATIFLNECSQLSYDAVLTVRTRLAQKVARRDGKELAVKAYYDLNPVGRTHWTYKEFVENVRPDNGMPLPKGVFAYLQMNPSDNPHLPKEYLDELAMLPEKQRQRFLDGRYLAEVPGALWPLERVDASRVGLAPELKRIVVAVDPSGSNGAGGDTQGVVVAGICNNDEVYILEDASACLSPAGWGRRVVDKFHEWRADAVVAESNYGGAMVKHTIETQDPNVHVKLVHATRGKVVRAEPVAALYESTPDKPARVHHVGRFTELEDQMATFTTDGYQGTGSPDRVDALVWAVTELVFGRRRVAGMFLKSRYRKAS